MDIKMGIKMEHKRKRSINWDEEEKHLLTRILKNYFDILENKSLKNCTNQEKNRAWNEIHRKFNEINRRYRDMNQLKVQWKTMKVMAKKAHSSFVKDENETGDEPRPGSPGSTEDVEESKDFLEAAEPMIEYLVYDSDGIVPSSSAATSSETCADTLPDKKNKMNRSRILKEREHRRFMKMAEEEHLIKMAIHREKLKSAILEREILEIKKRREESIV